MQPPLELAARGSHLYPGATGRVLSGGETAAPALVHFADGSQAEGEVARAEGGWQLTLGAYVTAAGTEIAPRTWLMTFTAGPGFRITGRV